MSTASGSISTTVPSVMKRSMDGTELRGLMMSTVKRAIEDGSMTLALTTHQQSIG